MKSRQKFTVSDNNLHSRSECSALQGRRNFSYPALRKHVDFLQTYNRIFRQDVCQTIGDADRYFRNSLRSEPFDLIRDLNLDKRSLVRSVRSLEHVCRRKPRSRQTLPSFHGPADLSRSKPQPEEDFLEIYSSPHTNKPESSDTDSESKEFLTPRQTELDLVEEVSEDETPKHSDSEKMADEEETTSQTEETQPEQDLGSPLPLFNEDDETSPSEYDEEEDDEMREVEEMVCAASQELQHVVEENEKIMGALAGDETGESGQETGPVYDEAGDSPFNYNPAIDSAVLRELEAAEAQAKATATAICELRNRVAELLKKDKMTEAEARELEEKNAQLKRQMTLFEEKIKRIQFLIAQTNLFESMVPPCGTLQTRHDEDKLPKVIVCGLTENNMPKIIVCNDGAKRVKCGRGAASMTASPRAVSPPGKADVSPRTEFAKRLNDCICMQEKLAAENADLEGKRFKLQSDVLNKDQAVENLQQQLAGLQAEMRMICQENVMLNNKLKSGLTQCAPRSQSPSPVRGKGCGRSRGVCPADVESRLQEYSKNTEILEKHLGDMENEIRGIQNELVSVQKEREHLEHHRKMLCPPPTCFPPCIAPPCAPPKPSNDQQLRELREQYNRLQDDFKNKLIEVSSLRTENEKLKDTTKGAEQAKKAAEDKTRELENEMKRLRGATGKRADGSKEQMIEIEQQLNVARQRFREAQDELEELRALTEDQREQLGDYRNKYLEAQQSVEEQRRHIDLMEIENQRVSEQVNLEIQRVKNQFQEKLQELMPLPDILKATQLKLQEAQQMHLLAERNNEAIGRELKMYRDKVAALTNQIDEVRSDQQLGSDAQMAGKRRTEDLERQLGLVEEENNGLKNELDELQEKADEATRLAEERLHEITQLESQLENVREESARQIARTKERCEIVRKSMQNTISDLERQMAQSRAIAKAAQKDRDDIRAKMQAQINNLNENFEDAQMRIRNLQGHVNFLKNSYGDVQQPQQDEKKVRARPDPCFCASDY